MVWQGIYKPDRVRHYTTMPVDYSKAKIYKIWSPSTDKQYIGSTCDELRKRLHLHKSHYKRYLEGKYNYVSSFEVLKHPDYRIVLIEARVCGNKMEVLRLEADHIRNNVCVNKVMPGAVLLAGKKQYKDQYNQEYYQNNRDAVKARNTEYRQNNRDVLYAKQNTKHDCLCGGRYTQQNRLQHKKTMLHRMYIQNLHNELNHLANL